MMITQQLLPPPLVHELRARSFSRLFRMTGNPGNRGFGRYLRQRIHVMVRRERTLVEKAITVAYLCSYLTDHLIFAEQEAVRILEQRSLGDAEEHSLWARNYQSVVTKLLAELPEGDAILQEMQRLDRFTTLPPAVYRLRSRHWRQVQRILHGPLADQAGNVSEIPLVSRVHDILNGQRPPESKAMAVCLAASMLADMECWSSHLPWPEAYQKVMTELYPVLQRQPDVLARIIRLD
jgi:hypothetical protein